MEKSVKTLGICWYLEGDYDALRALFTDGGKLPRSFLQWQDQVEQLRKRYVRQGYIVAKAHIDPATFPAWCVANDCDVDSAGRIKFANAAARRIAVEAQKNS